MPTGRAGGDRTRASGRLRCGTDLKNLIAGLALCELAGELEHAASVGQLAGAMGCAGTGAGAAPLRGWRHGPFDILDQARPMRTSALWIRSARTTVQVQAWQGAPTECAA